MKRWIWIGIGIDCIIVTLTFVYVFSHTNSQDVVNAQVTPQAQYAVLPLQATSFEPASSTTFTHFSDSTNSSPKKISTTYTLPNISSYSVSQLVSILRKIAQCESENNPYAHNPTSSAKGLLQILDSTWQDFQCSGDVYNLDDNMQCGIKIASESGLQHWNASRSCWAKLVYN